MENKIDRTKYDDINLIVKKTKYLRNIYSYYNKEDVVLFYLDKLIPEHDEDILARIEQVYEDMRKNCHDEETSYSIKGRNVEFYQLHWAKLCIFAYFYYHGEPLWEQMIFDRLLQKVELEVLRDDIDTAQSKIDKYYKDRDAIKRLMHGDTADSGKSTIININAPIGQFNANVEQLITTKQ